MPTITLKNIPAKVHRRLKQMALSHKRSLNSEILFFLETVTEKISLSPDTENVLKQAETLHKKTATRLTDRELRRLKKEGRP